MFRRCPSCKKLFDFMEEKKEVLGAYEFKSILALEASGNYMLKTLGLLSSVNTVVTSGLISTKKQYSLFED